MFYGLPLADIILALFILFMAYVGYSRGLIQTVGQIGGAVAGFWIAQHWASPVANIVHLFTRLDRGWVHVGVFVLIFLVADRLISLIFWLIDKLFTVVTGLPFLASIHALLGALAGIVEAVFFIGSISYVALTLSLNPLLINWISGSRVAVWSQSLFYRLLGFLV